MVAPRSNSMYAVHEVRHFNKLGKLSRTDHTNKHDSRLLVFAELVARPVKQFCSVTLLSLLRRSLSRDVFHSSDRLLFFSRVFAVTALIHPASALDADLDFDFAFSFAVELEGGGLVWSGPYGAR